MMIAEECSRRFREVQRTLQDFIQAVNVIDGNFESREAEIKALELRRDKLKEEVKEIQDKSTSILQEASEQSGAMRKEALSLLEEAKIAKLQVQEEMGRAQRQLSESQALYAQAVQRQKEADTSWRMMEDKKKRIEEAVRG